MILSWKEQTLELCPEKAIFWKDRSTLFIADPHFGKAAHFRRLGVPVPQGTTTANLARLSGLLERTGAQRLIVLGDFLHSAHGRADSTLDAMQQWRDAHQTLDILLIRGNHDLRAGDPPPALNIQSVREGYIDAPFVLAHHPDPSEKGYVLAGHIHPVLNLAVSKREWLCRPGFIFGPEVALLPSFGEFTGGALYLPEAEDRLFAVAPEGVLEIYNSASRVARKEPFS
jgi:DNA ligase-associated metallophosphoesterase